MKKLKFNKKIVYPLLVLLTMALIGNVIFYLKMKNLIKTLKVPTEVTTADLKQIDGLFVYTDSQPHQKHEVLGVLTITFTIRGQYTDIRDSFILECKTKYPDADGLILSLTPGTTDVATVIKFIDND